MNDSSIEQQSMSLTPEATGLTTPHFDDSAVATAHQVEPLRKRRAHRFESSRYGLMIAFAIIVGIVLGISAVLISSGSRGDHASPPVLAQASAQMDSLDDAAAQASAIDSSGPRDSSVARDSSTTRQKSPARIPGVRARRTIDRYMAEDFSEDDNSYSRRPASRRVGVLYYGRWRNEP